MARNMLETFRMVKNKEEEKFFGWMEIHFKDNGKMERDMEQARQSKEMDNKYKKSGNKVKKFKIDYRI